MSHRRYKDVRVIRILNVSRNLRIQDDTIYTVWETLLSSSRAVVSRLRVKTVGGP